MMKICIGRPIEQTRAVVPLSVIQDHYDRLDRYLERAEIPPEFFFNVDETGFQSWADKCNKYVVVPMEFQGSETYVSVNRNNMRSTMIGCI